MGSLYEIVKEFTEFKNQLEDMEIDEETFRDTLESIQLPLETKVENIVKYMKTLEALADAKKLEAKRLSESASADLKKVEWFKNYMADNLKKAGINKLQAGLFSLGWRKGSEIVEIDESKLPPQYLIPQPPKPWSKTEFKRILKEIPGKEIPGVSLVRKEDTLTIK